MLKDHPPLLLKCSELVEAWRETLQAFDKFTEQSVKGCFFHMKMKVMLKILHHLSEENKLSIYDERIFEYFQHLMHHYQMTIKLFYDNEKNIKTGKAKEILSGICTVLSSQIKQFRENQMVEQGINDAKATENPIKLEKDRFMTELKINILNQLDDIEKQWITNEMINTLISSRKNIIEITKNENIQNELLKEIYNNLIYSLKESLYKCYIIKSKDGVEKLNAFHLRKAANFYYESIKQEKENVEAIIRIQVNALEEEMKLEACEEEEQQIIQEILHTIREAYQHLGKEIRELEHFFKETEKQSNKINLYNLEEFEEYLRIQGMDSYIDDINVRNKFKDKELINAIERYNIFNEIWEKFKTEFLKISIEQVQEKEIFKSLIQKVQSSIEMAQKIMQVFLEFSETHKVQKDRLQGIEFAPIIEGISETIEIKVESLKESMEIFSTAVDVILEDIKEELELPKVETEYEKIDFEIYDKFFKESIKEYPLEQLGFMEWGYNFLDKQKEEVIDYLYKRLNRRYGMIEQGVNKKIIRFFREHLLFEMSTYEEIVYYSVSKLRESQEDIVISYVNDIDTLTQSLEEIMKDYGIEFIYPNPHERFNGKKHEVLMAEVKEGFEKGEIIKTMNRGYVYSDQIVLKANVIAGK